MAIRIANKNPLEVSKRTAIGVSIPFNATDVFNSTYTTVDQVKSNLINFILTNKGERLFDPTFGGNLRASLFEPDSSFDSVAARLETEIYAYVPNIIIKNIEIIPISDQNIVNISLSYSINNQNDNLVINVSTNNLSEQ